MKKILFLHGFFASGQCVPALALRDAFKGRALVFTPDLPMHPKEAITFIHELIDCKKPNLIVGNSCGSFYAQMVASELLMRENETIVSRTASTSNTMFTRPRFSFTESIRS